MLAVPALFGWGIHLFRILGSGYIASTRYRLLAFHLADFVFCGAWLMSSFSRNGNSGMIFSPGIRTVGFTILLIPVFTVLFTSPTIQPDPVAPLARAFSPNRASRRLVAWLAARIR
ncbi:MAG: hypothetical protein ABIS50_09580 [Luteolibacter sp.]|uniref:hypothetical protein n=1 Tax=Luteolibacter sp. TaxID=1962973 RepID=UPI003262FEC0